MTLTPIQAHTLKLIQDFITQHGFPPTTRELAFLRGCGQTTAYQAMLILKRKGYIAWNPRISRTLRILNPEEP